MTKAVGYLRVSGEGQLGEDRYGLAAAQRDFLSACRTLAQVRKLELPFVQVNVAERQQVQNLIVPGGPHERPGDVPAHREPGAVRRNSPQGH